MTQFCGKFGIALFCGAMLLTGCGGGGGMADDASGASAQSSGSNGAPTWTLNDRSYTTSSASSTTNKNGSKFDVVSLASDNDTANGDYSGSLLSFSVARNGAGTYTTTASTSELVAAIDADPSAQVIYVQCQVGTGVLTGSTVYRSMAGATVQVTVGVDGDYRFTALQTQTFTHGLDVQGGVAGAPDTAPVTYTDVYDL